MINIQFLSGSEAADALGKEKDDSRTMELVNNLVGGFADDLRRSMEEADVEQIDWVQISEKYLNSVDELKQQKQIITVMHDEKPVGMAGYKRIGQDPHTGHEVYEISHVSVLEEGKGKLYGKKLATMAAQQIRATNPKADITFGSLNKSVNAATRYGFEPISLERYFQIKHSKMDVNEFADEMEKLRSGKAQYFLLPAEKEI